MRSYQAQHIQVTLDLHGGHLEADTVVDVDVGGDALCPHYVGEDQDPFGFLIAEWHPPEPVQLVLRIHGHLEALELSLLLYDVYMVDG